MSIASVRKVYDGYSKFYDLVFGSIFQPGRELSTDLVNRHAAQQASVLEVGVGTGLSLPMYRSDLRISGIDISAKMLKKAHECVAKNALGDRVSLQVMDAAHLEYPDNSFDYVVAMYVVSVVPDPIAFFSEIKRVCKPNAKVIFLNHFASEKPALQFIEKKLAGMEKIVGFKTNFSIDAILTNPQFQLIQTYPTNLLGYWKLVHCNILK
jgi:phosphatidylethanolamine/phosphatidyl-N-methylethanolamine N-methyltransferase